MPAGWRSRRQRPIAPAPAGARSAIATWPARPRRAATYVMYHWGALPGRRRRRGPRRLRADRAAQQPRQTHRSQLRDLRAALSGAFPAARVALRCGRARTNSAAARGAAYRVVVEAEAEYAFRGEGQRTPSGYGVHGGGIGAAGAIAFIGADGNAWVPPQFGAGRLGPVEIRIDSPAGGGWGDPKERDPERVLRDVRDGYVSEGAARAFYGVALSADRRSVDQAATRALRSSM